MLNYFLRAMCAFFFALYVSHEPSSLNLRLSSSRTEIAANGNVITSAIRLQMLVFFISFPFLRSFAAFEKL